MMLHVTHVGWFWWLYYALVVVQSVMTFAGCLIKAMKCSVLSALSSRHEMCSTMVTPFIRLPRSMMALCRRPPSLSYLE